MKKERKLSPLRAVVRILPLVVKHSPGWVTLEMLLSLSVSALSAVILQPILLRRSAAFRKRQRGAVPHGFRRGHRTGCDAGGTAMR